MNNWILLISFLLLTTLSTAQSQSAKGILTKNNGKTIPVTFVIPIFHKDIMNPLLFQNKPKFLLENNEFEIDMSDYTTAQFQFGGRSYTFKRFSYIKEGITSYKFRHLIQDGDVQLYRNYFPAAFQSGAVTSDFFLVDTKQKSIPLKPLNFRKKLVKLFNSCPKFAKLIRSKRIKYRHLDEVVADIDSYCE